MDLDDVNNIAIRFNTLPRPNDGVWFGWEITGYFVPEETGTYEFKISSEMISQIFIWI